MLGKNDSIALGSSAYTGEYEKKISCFPRK
jgi:hypothetical protein